MLRPILPRPATEENEGPSLQSRRKLQFLTTMCRAWNGERNEYDLRRR